MTDRPDACPYTVGRSRRVPGRWAVYRNGVETRHTRDSYDAAVTKAQKLNRRAG